MMLFHVPQNVSTYIQCGSRSACGKRTDVTGFALWFSCPVCAYRICAGCASVDIPDYADRDKNTLESILVRQFKRYWTNQKRPSKVETFQEESPGIPGQL